MSLRQVRATLETARALESLPSVAAAAHAGRLSDPQLTATARLADPQTDAEWARRAADALVELARGYADARPLEHSGPLLVVEVPVSGPATVVGIPLPDSMVERLQASASIEPLLVDHAGTPRQTGRREPAISPKNRRAVLRRDGRCRFVGCDRRHGLQVHHLWPRSWGGTDDMANLAAVCVGGGTAHHEQLAPHGPWLLLGNPNQPDGLRLVHRDELPGLASLAARAPARGRPPARAGPSAA